jgi:hypothetical protein
MTQGLLNLDSVGNSVHPYCLARAWIISNISALLYWLLAINTTPSPFSCAKKKDKNPAFAKLVTDEQAGADTNQKSPATNHSHCGNWRMLVTLSPIKRTNIVLSGGVP